MNRLLNGYDIVKTLPFASSADMLVKGLTGERCLALIFAELSSMSQCHASPNTTRYEQKWTPEGSVMVNLEKNAYIHG